MNVLIVPDKFKGTLTASQAAELIAVGWRRVRPDDRLDLLPMSDDGEGFGHVIADILGLPRCTTMTVNAAHQPWDASWWEGEADRIALIEAAQVTGVSRERDGTCVTVAAAASGAQAYQP